MAVRQAVGRGVACLPASPGRVRPPKAGERMNVVVLVGRLVRDPELRYTPNGIAVGSFTLAVDRPFTNQQGEREADFIDVVVWRGLAETVAQHLQKGRMVAVHGRLQVRTFETADGP